MSDFIEIIKIIVDNMIIEEGIYNEKILENIIIEAGKKYNNIKLDYISNNITHKYNRLLIRTYNNLNTNNNLLIITRNPILHEKQANILDKLEIFYNKNIYDNIFIMNIITNDDKKNLIIFKKIFELFPDINILLCYGDKFENKILSKKNNNILFELDKIFIENNFYERQLVKCLGQTCSHKPYNIIQSYSRQEKIDYIINKKNFNEYDNYNIV